MIPDKDCPDCETIDREVSKGETTYPGVGLGLTLVLGLLFWGAMYFMVFK